MKDRGGDRKEGEGDEKDKWVLDPLGADRVHVLICGCVPDFWCIVLPLVLGIPSSSQLLAYTPANLIWNLFIYLPVFSLVQSSVPHRLFTFRSHAFRSMV